MMVTVNQKPAEERVNKGHRVCFKDRHDTHIKIGDIDQTTFIVY